MQAITHMTLCLTFQEDECRPYTRDVMFIFQEDECRPYTRDVMLSLQGDECRPLHT